jgi:O-acetylhomoserine (thiol)-lyase
VQKHSENGLALAEWLETQDQVAWVNYPGLKSSKYYDLAKEYLPKGQNGIVTFGLREVLKRLRLLLMKRKYFHF